MTEQCPTCPAPEGTTCLAIRTGHRRYCTLCEVRDDYRALVGAGSTDEPYEPPPDPVDPALVSLIEATPTPILARILACPDRASSCHCLTKPAECLGNIAPERAGVVGFVDCRGCVLERQLTPPC